MQEQGIRAGQDPGVTGSSAPLTEQGAETWRGRQTHPRSRGWDSAPASQNSGLVTPRCSLLPPGSAVVSAQGLVPLRWGCALPSPNAPGKAPNHTATPVHRPQRPAGSTHSSTRGLRPPEQLERPAGFPSSALSSNRKRSGPLQV